MSNVVRALVLLCLAAGMAKGCRQYCLDESCRSDPGLCFDGEVELCGRRVCAKGPGEKCGGVDNFLGKCGSGMHCESKRPGGQGFCSGCSAARIGNGVKPFCKIWTHDHPLLY